MGTTIAELGSNTITLAQLAAIISQIQSQQNNTGGGNIGTGNEGTLVPGPGLAGGGVLIGNVPIRLVAPIPWGLEGGGGDDGDSGPPGMAGVRGVNGVTGGVGPIGPAIFMAADDGQDGDSGPTGAAGVSGAAGSIGPAGPAGTTLVYANTTVPGGNTVANTSSETFFTSAYSIPAGSMTIGMAIRVKLFGVYSTGIVAPSLALKIYFGATAMIVSGTLTTVANVTNDGWSAEGLFIVQTIGVAGTIEAQGLSEFSTASTAVLFVNMDNAAPVTVDTTIAENIRASVQWGGTVNASDTITLREMTVEIMSTAGIPVVASSPVPFAVFFGEDGEDGSMGPPGISTPGGTTSSNPFNVTPDTHTSTPTFVENDEFEIGGSIDTAGTRFSGATAWTIQNSGGVGTNSVQLGALIAASNKATTDTPLYFTQPIAATGAAWDYRCKGYALPLFTSGTQRQAVWVGTLSTGKGYVFGRLFTAPNPTIYINEYSNFNTGIASLINVVEGSVALAGSIALIPDIYFRIKFDGASTITFMYSFDGLIWRTTTTVNTATFLGAAATGWGIVADGGANPADSVSFDWARRYL